MQDSPRDPQKALKKDPKYILDGVNLCLSKRKFVVMLMPRRWRGEGRAPIHSLWANGPNVEPQPQKTVSSIACWWIYEASSVGVNTACNFSAMHAGH